MDDSSKQRYVQVSYDQILLAHAYKTAVVFLPVDGPITTPMENLFMLRKQAE